MNILFEQPLKSSLADISWPIVTTPQASAHLSLQYQLEYTQWLQPAEIKEKQLQQIQKVCAYALKHVPFYKTYLNKALNRNGGTLTWDIWQQFPILRREDIQAAGHTLLAKNLPRNHGKLYKTTSSGSTGKPVTVWHTDLTSFFWRAFTMREHLWHQRNFAGKLAAIRAPESVEAKQHGGLRLPGWGPSTDVILETGPACVLDIRTPVDEQAAWLMHEQPEYLLTYPTNALALAHYFNRNGGRLSSLSEIRTLGEAGAAEITKEIKAVFAVEVTDIYSAREVGYIALQCPEHRNYHVQSENVLVEILDDNGRQCGPGAIGKVVVTSLNNFATPLMRYDIGDYAEAGEPCSCGRGLPVIKKILGRARNMLTLPNGKQYWPSFDYKALGNIVSLRQYRILQHSVTDIEAQLVVEAQATPDQEKEMREILQKSLPHHFNIRFTYVNSITRTKGGKYEDFMSLVA